MDQMWHSVVVIFTGILAVATLAVIFSKQANTQGVIREFTQGFGTDLGVALSPIIGSAGLTGISGNMSLPDISFGA